MFERFTDRARRVLVLAQEEARLLNHDFIGTEHILLGLLREEDGVAARALAGAGVKLGATRTRVKDVLAIYTGTPGASPPFTPRAKKVLELSLREALGHEHSYIGTEHLLLGTLREGEGVACQILREECADLAGLRQQVEQLMAAPGTGTGPESPTAPGEPPGVARSAADREEDRRLLAEIRVTLKAAQTLLRSWPDETDSKEVVGAGTVRTLTETVLALSDQVLRLAERVLAP